MVSACLWWRAESLVSRGDWQDGFVSGEILYSTVGSGGLQSIEHHMANVLLEYMPLSLSRCFCHAVLKNVSHAYFLFFIYTICSRLDKIVSKLVCNCFLWIIAIRLHTTSFLGWGRFIKLQEKRFLSYRFTQSSELYRIQEKYFVFTFLHNISWMISPRQTCCVVICRHGNCKSSATSLS